MIQYEQLLARLPNTPTRCLMTGVTGFIGFNLLEALLRRDQRVVGLDNFAMGQQCTLDGSQELVTPTSNQNSATWS